MKFNTNHDISSIKPYASKETCKNQYFWKIFYKTKYFQSIEYPKIQKYTRLGHNLKNIILILEDMAF